MGRSLTQPETGPEVHGTTRHGPGETSGSPQRPAQRLTGELLTFDLDAELRQLRSEPAWRRGDRNAKTLVKVPALQVVLTAIKSSARIQGHKVDAPFTLQAVAGRLRLHVAGQAIEMSAGQLLALEPGVAHDVEALEESAFLLTMGGRLG
jgi:quercetin dioxygenase-like cupin family protein